MSAFNKGNCSNCRRKQIDEGRDSTRDISQQHNEINQEGNVEGAGSGNGSEFEGHFKKTVQRGTDWKVDQEEALKVTFGFTV